MSKNSKTCLREKGAFYKALEKHAQQQIDDLCYQTNISRYDSHSDYYDEEYAYAEDVKNGLYDTYKPSCYEDDYYEDIYNRYEDDYRDNYDFIDPFDACIPGKYYKHRKTGVSYLCCYIDNKYHFINVRTGREESVYRYELTSY